MIIESCTNFAAIPVDKATWNKFAQQNETNTIFQTYEWFESWWSTFGDQQELLFLTARDASGLRGFVPLMSAKNQWLGKTLRFASDENADYCDFIVCGNRLEVIDAFLTFLTPRELRWTNILFLNIPEYSTTKACLQTLSANRKLKVQIKTPSPTPTLLIKQHEANALQLTKKYSIKRHLHKLEKMGEVTSLHLRTEEEILPHLESFFQQHRERYILKNEVSLFTQSKNRNFYRLLTRKMSDNNWLLFTLICLNGKPVAFHFGFQYNEVLLWYKPSFGTEYQEYSPGSIMIKYLIEHAIDSSCNELDFSVGKESFKSRFCNLNRHNQNIAIYRSSLLYQICRIKQFAGILQNKLTALHKSFSTRQKSKKADA